MSELHQADAVRQGLLTEGTVGVQIQKTLLREEQPTATFRCYMLEGSSHNIGLYSHTNTKKMHVDQHCGKAGKLWWKKIQITFNHPVCFHRVGNTFLFPHSAVPLNPSERMDKGWQLRSPRCIGETNRGGCAAELMLSIFSSFSEWSTLVIHLL